MAIVIRRVRISFFWSTRFSSLLDNAPPPGAPLAALGHIDTYAKVFEQLMANPTTPVQPASGAPPLELPWPPKGTHWFWSRYLNANPIKRISGAFAFVRLIPLRRRGSPAPGLMIKLPEKLAAQTKFNADSVVSEAWFHPHMATFGLHVNAVAELAPASLADVCLAVRRDRVFYRAAAPAAMLKLDELATDQLGALRDEALGPAAGSLPPANPFSLVSVLQGEHQGEGVPDGGEVHKSLDNIVRWQAAPAEALATSLVSSRAAPSPSGPLLLGRARARAVWDPTRFEGEGRTSLSCYHRNLFVGTLQTEALLSFASIAGSYPAPANRPKAVRDCEDAVLKRIVALHAGQEDATYRSASLRRFIDDHPSRAAVNDMADRLHASAKLPALAAAAAAAPAGKSPSAQPLKAG